MTFEEELMSALDPLIKMGDIVVLDSSDAHFSRLGEIFPTLGAKIDWDQVPESVEKAANMDDYLDRVFDFFLDKCEKYCLVGDVIVIGDSAIVSALIMSVDVLKACLGQIAEAPQHLYVIAEDYSWCMSFTMEGDMGFGFRP